MTITTQTTDTISPLPRWNVTDASATGMPYTDEEILSLWDGRGSLGAREILDLDVPVEDRLWAVRRMLHGHPVGARAAFCTLRRMITVHAATLPATRRWAEKWLSGEDRTADSAWSAMEAAERAMCTTWDTGEAAEAEIAASSAAFSAAADAEDVLWDWSSNERSQMGDIRAAIMDLCGFGE